jgi:hypothetical protein
MNYVMRPDAFSDRFCSFNASWYPLHFLFMDSSIVQQEPGPAQAASLRLHPRFANLRMMKYFSLPQAGNDTE